MGSYPSAENFIPIVPPVLMISTYGIGVGVGVVDRGHQPKIERNRKRQEDISKDGIGNIKTEEYKEEERYRLPFYVLGRLYWVPDAPSHRQQSNHKEGEQRKKQTETRDIFTIRMKARKV